MVSKPSARPPAMKSPTTSTTRASGSFFTAGGATGAGAALLCGVAFFRFGLGLLRSAGGLTRSLRLGNRSSRSDQPKPVRSCAMAGAEKALAPRSRIAASTSRTLIRKCALLPTQTPLPQDKPLLCLVLAKPLQHFKAGIAILPHSHLGLKGHDGCLRAGADLAVELAIIKAALGETFLQFLFFLEGKLGEGPVPVPHKTAIAPDLVGQQPNCQSISVGIVVTLEHRKVLDDQEGRPFAPIRHLEFGSIRAVREWLAIGALYTNGLPLGNGESAGRELAAWRQHHLVAPGAAALPAIPVKQIRSRRQRIGHGVPDVPLAVAVHVDGVGLVTGGDELGMAHGARPGALQMAFVYVARLQDLECRNQLRAGKFRALLVGVTQGGQRAHDIAHHVVPLEDLTVVGFHRPDGKKDVAVNAVALLDAIEPRLPLARHCASGGNRFLVSAIIEIVPDRRLELGLMTGLLQDFVVNVRDVAESPVVHGARNAVLHGDRAETGNPVAEARVSKSGLGRHQQRQRQAG